MNSGSSSSLGSSSWLRNRSAGRGRPTRPVPPSSLLTCTLRRSRRLQGQQLEASGTRKRTCSQAAPATPARVRALPAPTLSDLPMEVLFQIFLKCDVTTLGLLSLCSRNIRDDVADYLGWSPAIREFQFKDLPTVEALRRCRNLGVMLKRVTCLLPTRDRIRIMVQFIEQFLRRPVLLRCRLPHDLESAGREWRLYGAFMMSAVAGWVETPECQLVHDVLIGLSAMQRFASRVLGARPGHLRREELVLRRFVHSLFLCEAGADVSVNWLMRLLQPWPLVFRAKLLFILYGPYCNHEILWNLPCMARSATGFQLLRESMENLAAALRCLHQGANGWNSDDTVTVLEELTGLPRPWRPMNCALLLAHCGQEICVSVLASKLVNGRDEEVASVLFNMICVRALISSPLTLVVSVVNELRELSGHDRYLTVMPGFADRLFRIALAYFGAYNQSGFQEFGHSLLSFIVLILQTVCSSSQIRDYILQAPEAEE